jgi:hypothetical protein
LHDAIAETNLAPNRDPQSKSPVGYRRRLSPRSRVFNIDQEFFSKLCIFSPISASETMWWKREQQMRHLLPS